MPLRGEIWSVDLEPQAFKDEPGKRKRPALVIQSDSLNKHHRTTIIIPGTSQHEGTAPADQFPLKVRIQRTARLEYDTDLLVDQLRAISNQRLIERLAVVGENHLKKIEHAIRLITGR